MKKPRQKCSGRVGGTCRSSFAIKMRCAADGIINFRDMTPDHDHILPAAANDCHDSGSARQGACLRLAFIPKPKPQPGRAMGQRCNVCAAADILNDDSGKIIIFAHRNFSQSFSRSSEHFTFQMNAKETRTAANCMSGSHTG